MSNPNGESSGANHSLRSYILRMLGWSVLVLLLACGGVYYSYMRYVRAASVPGTPTWVNGRQMFTLHRSVILAYGASALATGHKATDFTDSRPYTLVWPLTPAGEPWPLVSAGSAVPPPRIVWLPREKVYHWALEDSLFDRVLRPLEQASLDPIRLARPPDSRMSSDDAQFYTALALPYPVQLYQSDLKQLPASPADAYALFHLALVREPFARLQARYPTIEFYCDHHYQSTALLLTEANGERSLIYRNLSKRGPYTGDYSDPEDRDTIDQILAGLTPWGDLSSVPIIDLPPLPKGAEPDTETP